MQTVFHMFLWKQLCRRTNDRTSGKIFWHEVPSLKFGKHIPVLWQESVRLTYNHRSRDSRRNLLVGVSIPQGSFHTKTKAMLRARSSTLPPYNKRGGNPHDPNKPRGRIPEDLPGEPLKSVPGFYRSELGEATTRSAAKLPLCRHPPPDGEESPFI